MRMMISDCALGVDNNDNLDKIQSCVLKLGVFHRNVIDSTNKFGEHFGHWIEVPKCENKYLRNRQLSKQIPAIADKTPFS